jgi:hypothetical protein
MKGASRTTLMEPMDQRQMAPAEAMRETLKQAMRGDMKAQKEVNELMKEMRRCMHGEERGEVPYEPEEWSPKRGAPVKPERPARPTPPTRPPTKPMETRKTIDM